MHHPLSEATWTDVREVDADCAFLPVGSTEQHGPHAPLGTDTLAATAVAEAGAEAAGADVLVAPPLPFGIAEEHRAFAGTMWLSPATFRRVVRESVRSLARHGVSTVVVVNGHGGNAGALREATARVTRDGVAYAVPFTWFEAVGEYAAEMGHGGKVETSLLRHARPDLVREDRVATARDGAADRWGEWVSGANLAYDTEAFAENGVVGDPSAGDAALGAELLELAAAALVDLLAAARER
jgi:creatinine amidohydrolase